MKSFQKGQTIIEIIVALGVGIIMLTTITVAVTTTLSNAQFASQQSRATQLAQEGMDTIRTLRDTNYASFNSISNFLAQTYCLDQGDIIPSALPCTPIEIYTRTVIFNNNSEACTIGGVIYRRATVVVSWADGKCSSGANCHTAETASCFTNYNVVPTPN